MLDDDGLMLMGESAPTLQQRGSAGFAVCEAAGLASRTHELLADLRERLGAFAADPRTTRRLAAHELEELGSLSDELAELASHMALIIHGLPIASLAADEREIAEAARAALADGIVDHGRALTAAGLLSADQGFPALAEALIDCDAHAYWPVRVIDMVAAFRDVDGARARQVVALANVPETARFCELRPESVLELARTLHQLGGR